MQDEEINGDVMYRYKYREMTELTYKVYIPGHHNPEVSSPD